MPGDCSDITRLVRLNLIMFLSTTHPASYSAPRYCDTRLPCTRSAVYKVQWQRFSTVVHGTEIITCVKLLQRSVQKSSFKSADFRRSRSRNCAGNLSDTVYVVAVDVSRAPCRLRGRWSMQKSEQDCLCSASCLG